jgi:hypothetical protein
VLEDSLRGVGTKQVSDIQNNELNVGGYLYRLLFTTQLSFKLSVAGPVQIRTRIVGCTIIDEYNCHCEYIIIEKGINVKNVYYWWEG